MDSTPLKFSQYLRTRPGAFSLAVVIITAAILGYFCVRTFFLPLQKSYPLDFTTAEWISSPDTPHGYFRKTLFLPADVIHAWIQVAAPDEYELFVNNVRVRDSRYFGVCTTGIHDLKPYLAEGRNTIAIHVSRITYPGAAQLLVRGGYISASSPSQEFHTDTTWKVSILEVQDRGGLPWTSPDLDDSGWPNAGSGRSDERPGTILPSRFPPELVRALPKAAWISPPEVRASAAAFRRKINVPAGRVETWLQVAATGSYDVLINGALVASRPLAAPTGPSRRANNLILSPYNISSQLHRGQNTILIHVRSESGTPAMLASAVIAHEEGVDTFGTDEAWMSSTHGEDSGGDWTTHAAVVGQYGDDLWPVSREPLALSQLHATSDFRSLSIWTAVILGTVCLVTTAWILASRVWAFSLHRPAADLWTADAMGHWCVAVVLLALFLVSYDIRFAPDWCFTPAVVLGAIVALLTGKLLLVFRRSASPAPEAGEPLAMEPPRTPRWALLVLLALMGIGGALRAAHLSDISFDVDEISVITGAKGVLVNGYPHVHLGSFTKRATTYEMTMYPLAAAGWLFGYSEAASRLPSVICATLTIGLIGWVGCRIFDWRAGLISALIYTFHATCLYWSRNAFWPSQAQMMTLLTYWCFYEALRTDPFRRGYLTATAAGVICSYLSWEGSGFILPALFLAMLAMRWGNFAWLRDWHLWRCFFIITVLIVLQLCHRKIASIPVYLQTGSTLAEITTPQVVYLDSTKFDPTYYLDNFATTESNYLLTVIFVCGLPFCWRDRRLRYLVVLALALFLSYSLLLPSYTVRYSYHYQTLLILAATGIFLKCLDTIALVARSSEAGWARPAAWIGSALAGVTLLLATNPFILKGYRLSSNPENASFIWRPGGYRADYRGAAAFVKERYRPGDAVIAPISHVFEHYTGIHANYSLNTTLRNRISYDGGRDIPRFIDRFRGITSLQSVEELQYVHSHYPRVWIVQVPHFPDSSESPDVDLYLTANQKVMFESYRSRVVLLESPEVRAPAPEVSSAR